MQALRNSLSLTRLVMAWFALTLGIAVASPIVQPQHLEMICGAGGSMQMVVLDDEGELVAGAHHSLDCPLCLSITTPPVYSTPHLTPPQPLGHALQPVAAARIAALVGAPLPPRGPPARV